MPTAIGIDFGTTTVRAAHLASSGQVELLGAPLPVWKLAGLPRLLALALPLKSNLASRASSGVNGSWNELALTLLTNLRLEAEKLLQTRVEGAVIGVPTQSGGLHREALRQCLQAAGFRAVRLINEPAAVALHHINPADGEKKLLVFSLGAGSLDLTVAVRGPQVFRELASLASDQISGLNFTTLLAENLAQHYHRQTGQNPAGSPEAMRELEKTAEEMKIAFSVRDEYRIAGLTLPGVPASGALNLTLSRAAFERLLAGRITDSLNLCQQVLEKAGFSSPQELDEIWLAGGSTQIPLLRRLVTEWSGKAPHLAHHAAVALGAGRQIPALDFSADPPSSIPASPTAAPEILSSPAPASLSPLDRADQNLAAGRFDEALAALQEMTELVQKKKAAVYYQRGLTLEKKGSLQEALMDFQQALRLDPQEGSYTQASNRIQSLQQHQQARVLYQQGLDWEKKNDPDRALEAFKKASHMHPENTDYRKNCARLLFQKAGRKIEQANRHQRPNMVRGAYKEALDWVREALSYDPDNPQMLEYARQIRAALAS
ncbi:MAG TPA: Hsp70 family protein [Anaerolineaceae bacterium]|nr:Hsp70 family protein [Anaerolineaceae bacterium]HPN50631.1 Hsp70 family protein [Anaerolineaceae bacterium]